MNLPDPSGHLPAQGNGADGEEGESDVWLAEAPILELPAASPTASRMHTGANT